MFNFASRKASISPEKPQYLSGHAQRDGKSTGIHDDIETVCYWIEVNGKSLCWIEVDVIKTDFETTNKIKKRISKQMSIPEDNIIICAGHTHTAPLVDHLSISPKVDEEYCDFMVDTIVGNAIKAHENQELVSASFAQGEVEGYYGNRNDFKREGFQSVYIIKLVNQDGKLVGTIINTSVHPTVLSPETYEITADLIGAMRRKFEAFFSAPCLLVNGVTGDMSTKYYRKGNDFAELERISEGIVNKVVQFSDYVELDINTVETKSFSYVVDYQHDVKTYNKLIEGHTKKLETEENYDERKWLLSQLGNFKRRVANPKVHFDIRTTIVNLGDLELVVIPGDPVTFFGKQIIRSSNKKLCLPLCHGNGECTYIIEAWEFGKGHSGFATQLKKGQAEEYVAKIINNLF